MYRSRISVTSNQGLARGGSIVAACLLLAACAQSGKSAPAPSVTSVPGVTSAPGVISAPAMIWRSADKLLGLAPEALLAALGAPARIRAEENARIYQYVGSDCVLDFFLYPVAEGFYRVSYAEARSILAEKQPVDTCLRSLPAPIVVAITQPGN